MNGSMLLTLSPPCFFHLTIYSGDHSVPLYKDGLYSFWELHSTLYPTSSTCPLFKDIWVFIIFVIIKRMAFNSLIHTYLFVAMFLSVSYGINPRGGISGPKAKHVCNFARHHPIPHMGIISSCCNLKCMSSHFFI